MALTARQQQCLDLMLAGHTQSSAAKQMRAGKATVSRWCSRPEFIIALAEAHAERRRSLNAIVDAAAPRALAQLVKLATDSKVSPVVQLKACITILDRAGVFSQEVIQAPIGEQDQAEARARRLARVGRVFEHPVYSTPTLTLIQARKAEEG